jgi:outer membrane protein assembly factor BamB
VVWDDFVFVPSPDPEKNLRLFCLAATNGAVRWERKVAAGGNIVGKNNLASCSPITDGKRAYVMFGTSDFAAFDFAGQEIWHRRLSEEFGAFAVQFLYGATPLLYGGKLYVPLLQRNPATYGHANDGKAERQSWLICIDPETGGTLWRQERRSDALEEAMEAYTTPIPAFTDTGVQLMVVGADCVTAHDPGSGRETWRFSGLNLKKNRGGRIVPSPVATPSHVFACGPKREMLVALRAEGGEMTDDRRVAWRTSEYVPDVCTPLYYQGKLFVLDGDRQIMTCFEPASGRKLWQGKLSVREIFYASPTGADGKIYCLSEEGTAVVLSAGESLEVLATIPMGEGPCGASIVPAGGRLYLRTARNLYCIKGGS